MSSRPSTRDAFRLAIFCALPLEADAVSLIFDERYPNQFKKAKGDANHYINGRIGNHDIVLTLIPNIGKVQAASAAAALKASYPQVHLAFLVGVCGGVPAPPGRDEIFRGDVVVANELIQYDLGRRYPNGVFVRKNTTSDSLGRLSKHVQSVLRTLEMVQGREDLESKAAEYLKDLQARYMVRSRRRPQQAKYTYPGIACDKLFRADFKHLHRGTNATCCMDERMCDAAQNSFCTDCHCSDSAVVYRSAAAEKEDPTRAQDPAIHIGRVASGDTVMKTGVDRDILAAAEGVLAFEMEGAGIWDEVPCIVVRGICDYADSHKDKSWQDFAAATAAATTKALLGVLVDTEHEEPEPVPGLVATSDPEPRQRDLERSITQRRSLAAQHTLYSPMFFKLAAPTQALSSAAQGPLWQCCRCNNGWLKKIDLLCPKCFTAPCNNCRYTTSS
jgi:nucleoside phosphorylase